MEQNVKNESKEMNKLLWEMIKDSKDNQEFLDSQTKYNNLTKLYSAFDTDTQAGLEKAWRSKDKELRSNEFEKLHVQNGGIVDTGDDGFYMDFANWVIAQGEELFNAFQKEGAKAVLNYIKKHNVSDDDYTFECMAYIFHK